jgi:DNA-binding transcriptional MerR regulator
MYPISEVAKHWGISPQRILFLIHAGKIKAQKIGNYYYLESLERAKKTKTTKRK